MEKCALVKDLCLAIENASTVRSTNERRITKRYSFLTKLKFMLRKKLRQRIASELWSLGASCSVKC